VFEAQMIYVIIFIALCFAGAIGMLIRISHHQQTPILKKFIFVVSSPVWVIGVILLGIGSGLFFPVCIYCFPDGVNGTNQKSKNNKHKHKLIESGNWMKS
jgi:hypothetical protein